MIIADFLFGLELFAALCTLVFIISLLAESPLMNNIFCSIRALLPSNTEGHELSSCFDLYSATNIKRSLLNQHVARRA